MNDEQQVAKDVGGVGADELVVINESGTPGKPIASLMAAPANGALWTVMSDSNLNVSVWSVKKVAENAPTVMLTLKTGQRLKVGAGSWLAVDVCRLSGSVVWRRAREIVAGCSILAINRHAPTSISVFDRLHYASELVPVNHVMETDPMPLYNLGGVNNYAIGDESGLCVIIGGVGLVPSYCAVGCVGVLSQLHAHPSFPDVSVLGAAVG